MFTKATKKSMKGNVLFTGTSGAGKTRAALRMAKGLAAGGKIAVLDTNNGISAVNTDITEFDMSVISAPFSYDKFTEGIKAAVEQGYKVIILDSFSSSWGGEGGILEHVDRLVISGKNKSDAWLTGNMLYNRLIKAITESDIHVIATVKTKTEYLTGGDQNDCFPRKVSASPMHSMGIDYDFLVTFDLDQTSHNARCMSDKTGLFDGFIDLIEVAHGETLLTWLDNGEKPVQSVATAEAQSGAAQPGGNGSGTQPADGKKKCINAEQFEVLNKKLKEAGVAPGAVTKRHEIAALSELPVEKFDTVMKQLDATIAKNKPGAAPSAASPAGSPQEPSQPAGKAGNVTDIRATLAALNIKVEELKGGEVLAKTDYNNTAAKKFLKESGGKWDGVLKGYKLKLAA